MVLQRVEQNQSELLRRLDQIDANIERLTDKMDDTRLHVIEHVDGKVKTISEVTVCDRPVVTPMEEERTGSEDHDGGEEQTNEDQAFNQDDPILRGIMKYISNKESVESVGVKVV